MKNFQAFKTFFYSSSASLTKITARISIFKNGNVKNLVNLFKKTSKKLVKFTLGKQKSPKFFVDKICQGKKKSVMAGVKYRGSLKTYSMD
jgi:catabolite regulation protein CreA